MEDIKAIPIIDDWWLELRKTVIWKWKDSIAVTRLYFRNRRFPVVDLRDKHSDLPRFLPRESSLFRMYMCQPIAPVSFGVWDSVEEDLQEIEVKNEGVSRFGEQLQELMKMSPAFGWVYEKFGVRTSGGAPAV